MKNIQMIISSICITLSLTGSVFATPIKYVFSGHIITQSGPLDTMSIGDSLFGWIELNSTNFTPGDSISFYDDSSYPNFYLSPQLQNGFLRPFVVTWGEALSAPLRSVNFCSGEDSLTLYSESMSFIVQENGTHANETFWTGTINKFEPVPEPATVFLFAMGLTVLVGFVKRGKSN